MYTKPVNCTGVHKTSLLCKCTQGLDSDRHFNINNERNLHGWTITMKRMYLDGTLHGLYTLCTSVHSESASIINWRKLKVYI